MLLLLWREQPMQFQRNLRENLNWENLFAVLPFIYHNDDCPKKKKKKKLAKLPWFHKGIVKWYYISEWKCPLTSAFHLQPKGERLDVFGRDRKKKKKGLLVSFEILQIESQWLVSGNSNKWLKPWLVLGTWGKYNSVLMLSSLLQFERRRRKHDVWYLSG